MKRIKFTLICPAAEPFRVAARNGKPARRMKVFRFSMLGPLCVAASTPDYVQTRIVDENVEPIAFDSDADVIGISFMTFNAPRAYEIANLFRRKGKVVFFGGYHPTLMPEEAAEHCDAVCIGEAEANLPRMFEDLRSGELQKLYSYRNGSLGRLTVDMSLIHSRQYIAPAVVQATRGCDRTCEFCSVSAFYRHCFSARPASAVVAQIKADASKSVLFIDDNIAADTRYARALFRALIPLKKHWYSQIGASTERRPGHIYGYYLCIGMCGMSVIATEGRLEASLHAHHEEVRVDMIHGIRVKYRMHVVPHHAHIGLEVPV